MIRNLFLLASALLIAAVAFRVALASDILLPPAIGPETPRVEPVKGEKVN